MKDKTSKTLTHELFQIMKQFPRLKFMKRSDDSLTRSEYELLAMLVMGLDGDKQAFTVTEISNMLQITPAGVTHLINPLDDAGFIERLHDKNDRRVVRIRPTKKAIEVAETLISEAQQDLTSLVNHLGEEDSKTLIRLMSKAMKFLVVKQNK